MNKLLKKGILAISLFAAAVFGFTGCGIVEMDDFILYQSGDTVVRLNGTQLAVGFLVLVAAIVAVIVVVNVIRKKNK